MFRRKEEGSADGSEINSLLNLSGENANSEAGTATLKSVNAMATPATNETNNSQNNAAAQPASPQVNPLLKTPSEPQRSLSSVPAGNAYRPTPVSDFSRGTARTSSEPARPAGAMHGNPASSAASIFNPSATDKTTEVKRSPRILTVGNDILLKGEIETCDRVIIEGRVEAKLSDVHTLAIAGCGSFKGTAEVEQAEITGLFEGDLIVNGRLVIYATGEVRGNITYGEIEIERGGRLTGQIKTVSEPREKAAKPTLLDNLEPKQPRLLKEAMEA